MYKHIQYRVEVKFLEKGEAVETLEMIDTIYHPSLFLKNKRIFKELPLREMNTRTEMKIPKVSTFSGPDITKTCLYDVDPLKPNFYRLSKTGLHGYTLFFLFLLKSTDCGTR